MVRKFEAKSSEQTPCREEEKKKGRVPNLPFLRRKSPGELKGIGTPRGKISPPFLLSLSRRQGKGKKTALEATVYLSQTPGGGGKGSPVGFYLLFSFESIEGRGKGSGGLSVPLAAQGGNKGGLDL